MGVGGWLSLIGLHAAAPFRGQTIALYISLARCANLHAPNRNAQHFLRNWREKRDKIFFIFSICATPARNTRF
jgi:hypothetical protein